MFRWIIGLFCIALAAFIAWNVFKSHEINYSKDESISISPTFMQLAEVGKLNELIHGNGPVTIFWPQDKAFTAADVELLKKPENLKTLQTILLNHVVRGEITTKDINSEMKVQSLAGHELILKKTGDKITVNDASIVKPDIKFTIFGHANGTIQVIDKNLSR